MREAKTPIEPFSKTEYIDLSDAKPETYKYVAKNEDPFQENYGTYDERNLRIPLEIDSSGQKPAVVKIEKSSETVLNKMSPSKAAVDLSEEKEVKKKGLEIEIPQIEEEPEIEEV